MSPREFSAPVMDPRKALPIAFAAGALTAAATLALALVVLRLVGMH